MTGFLKRKKIKVKDENKRQLESDLWGIIYEIVHIIEKHCDAVEIMVAAPYLCDFDTYTHFDEAVREKQEERMCKDIAKKYNFDEDDEMFFPGSENLMSMALYIYLRE